MSDISLASLLLLQQVLHSQSLDVGANDFASAAITVATAKSELQTAIRDAQEKQAALDAERAQNQPAPAE